MFIPYALVSRGEAVLCECSVASGNFQVITQSLLTKVFSNAEVVFSGASTSSGVGGATSSSTAPPPLKRLSYLYDQWLFHFVVEVETKLCFLCLAEREAGRRIPFTFLDQLRREFRDKFSPLFLNRGSRAFPQSLQSNFEIELTRLLTYYNSTDADAIRRVRGEIEEVQNVMVDNIEKILLRGEKIDLLVEKTETMAEGAVVFRREAAELRRIMWWRNCRIAAKLAFLIFLLVFLLIWYKCGFTFEKC